MKTSLSVLCLFLLFSQVLAAQDIITKRTGEDIEARVFEVTPTTIKYKRFDNIQGPTYSVLRSDIIMIRYENGAKEIYNTAPATEYTTSPREMYLDGQADAQHNYRDYKGAGTGTLITSLIMPLAGLVPAIACSATAPQEHNLNYPNPEFMKNADYRNGYTREAKKIKSRKVWTNWSIGLGVNLLFILAASK